MADPKTYNRAANRVYSGIIPALFDKIDVVYNSSVMETYTYSLYNPQSGNYIVQAIIEVVYTDSTKDNLQSVTKTFNSEEF